MKPGLAVEECVRRHKRQQYALKRLHQMFTARIGRDWYVSQLANTQEAVTYGDECCSGPAG